MAKRVLIAGCGYVGSRLAELLAAEGHEVTALRRSAVAMGPGITAIAADLVRGTGLEQLPEAIDTVFYTVGADQFSEEAYRAAYVLGLKNLLTALAARGGKPRVIYTSSTGVYAQDDGEQVDEQSEARPTKFSGRVLLEGETLALQHGGEASVVRFAGIYGPGRSRLIDQVRAGAAYTMAGRKQYLNLIHRDDCAGVLRHLMLLEAPAPVYVGVDNEPLERGELLQWIAARLGVPPPQVRAADEAPDPQRGGNRRASNALLRASGYAFKFPDARAGYGAMMESESA